MSRKHVLGVLAGLPIAQAWSLRAQGRGCEVPPPCRTSAAGEHRPHPRTPRSALCVAVSGAERERE
eukprot:scaffold174952_cov22-Tisochrysis_lutea.AAC.1